MAGGTGDETTRLDGWLRGAVGLVGPLDHRQVAGGLSNITSVVRDGAGRRVVVRRPPAGAATGGAHDVLREARIMAALGPTDVPVPHVVAMCTDPSVTGCPFYVMDYVDGEVVASAAAAAAYPLADRQRIALQLVDVLADLQDVDIDAVGLTDMRRSTPYLQRQLRRWSAQWQATATREVPAIDKLATELDVALADVDDYPDCLVHGDFRLGNAIVARAPRPHIAALLDWELATVGHPLADLGFLGARMSAPAEVFADDADPLSADGYPSFDELTARFAARTGVDPKDVPVFVALNAWRWAIIVEGIVKRLAAGQMGEIREDVDWHRRRVVLLGEFARDLLSRR